MNHAVLAYVHPPHVEVAIGRADALEGRRGLSSELDDMWSYGGKKAPQHWLWHAIEHHTGQVLASMFGRRQDDVLLRLKALLEPFGLTRYDTDGWGTDERHVNAAQHTVGKEYMPRIESTHSNLRTRIKRLVCRTIGFSQTEHRHELVIGLFVNRYECRRVIEHEIHNAETPWTFRSISPLTCSRSGDASRSNRLRIP